MIDWDANLLEPLDSVFGEEDLIVFYPKGGEPYNITGIFDRAYTREVETLEGDVAITTTKPLLGVRDICFASQPKQGDRVYIPRVKTLFVISDVQPDSHGGTQLELNEVRA